MDNEFFEDYPSYLPHVAGIALVVIISLIGLDAVVQSHRSSIQNREIAAEQTARDRALVTQLEEIEASRIVTEAEREVPDSLSVILHEWDCNEGELRAPIRTLGNPHNSNIRPKVSPRTLLDRHRTPVARLFPDDQIDYSLADSLGCPQVDPNMPEYFSEPQDPNSVPNAQVLR